MKMNVLAAVVASAGFATSALGQFGTYVIEVRLVVDGDPNAPIGAGITSYVPGESATRVGVSLQARVTQTASGTSAGSGNYGMAAVLATSSSSLARFEHNDSAFSGGSYLALRRGQTGAALGADGLPQAGFFGGENNPTDGPGGLGRNFRTLGGSGFGVADVNSPTGNAAGATGSNSQSGNGLFTNSVGGIKGLSAVIQLINASDPTRYDLGVASPWYNLYRAYFEPNPLTNTVARDVTVSFTGRLVAAVKAYDVPGGRALTTGGGNGGYRDVTNVSATFRVGPIPAPAAGVVLGLSGLVASRRRRA